MTNDFSSSKKKLHIIFDLDGTLIDSVGGIQYAMNAALNDLGVNGFDQTYYRNRVGRGAHELTKEICGLNKHITLNDLYSLYQSHYENNLYQDTHVYDGISDLLIQLVQQAVPLSVLTNKNHKFARPMVEHFFPNINYCSINGVKGDGLHKPQLAFIKRADLPGSQPNMTTLFIGDTPIDIECAKVSKAVSIAVTWGYCTETVLNNAQPDYLIHKPVELLSIIDSLTV